MVTHDEEPQKNAKAALTEDATAVPEALSRLRPAFKRDGGTVTAGNASTLRSACNLLVSPVVC